MKKWRLAVDAAWYVAVFLCLQLAATLVCTAVWPDFIANPLALSVSMMASSVATIVLFWAMRWWRESKAGIRSHASCGLYALVACLAVFSMLPALWLNEVMGVEPDEQIERVLMQVIDSPTGFLVIAVLVPLAEEVVFRGALLRRLLNRLIPNDLKVSKDSKDLNDLSDTPLQRWIAICISALAFGLVHGNVAQFIHAALLGVLLGWLYANTRSVLPGLMLHFVNNMLAFCTTKLWPESDGETLIQMFDGNAPMLYASLVVSIVLFAAALYFTQVKYFGVNGKMAVADVIKA